MESIQQSSRVRRSLIARNCQARYEIDSNIDFDAVLRICDELFLSNVEIVDFLFPPDEVPSLADFGNRIVELDAVSHALTGQFNGDHEMRIRWLRDSSEDLGGLQPFDYLRSVWSDANRVIVALHKKGTQIGEPTS